jgi:hypothetical protein
MNLFLRYSLDMHGICLEELMKNTSDRSWQKVAVEVEQVEVANIILYNNIITINNSHHGDIMHYFYL